MYNLTPIEEKTKFVLSCENDEYVETRYPKTNPHILDSGHRREFESGAVRDIQEGKGRCDLLPLDVVGNIYSDLQIVLEGYSEIVEPVDNVFNAINSFVETGSTSHLYRIFKMSNLFNNTPTMLLEVSKHFEEGCKKYGENNWRKGIPAHCYIDSAVRHYLKHLRGDKDEPHDRAFCWNILCCIWTCKNKPELNCYKKEKDVN